ncbi:AraC family transcriptional regulator [Cellulophaga sp. HaHaR_3_176]|uniref:AraC family transcriptional regulator n=1 Tax=Cellulophaga sp. HaHaR_3_176 TaxID=1942464 RepID=UPI001C200AEC|nr:AraC family transcriptional regulator [Cellulophaga sp. HaHaR_3_176]QWX82862.1 AraC family transcriptional regulator [Cellulophaga sp. HaHaR_3_176]
MLKLSDEFIKGRKLESLVENQTSYTLNNAAMHVFETHEQADKVMLQFDQPVLASMIMGKKVMHLRDHQSFQFLPGESLILPAKEIMSIDFPEAEDKNPTKCLAMAISEEKINNVLRLMNENMPKDSGKEWSLMDYNFHFVNDSGIYQILQRLLFLFTENHASKDFFVDNMLRELIIRILQTNQQKIYTKETLSLTEDNRLSFIVKYIRSNIHEPLTIEELSKKACMSPSHFHRVFKSELRISPVEFIKNERIKLAVSLLQNPKRKIKDVYMECGFESRSYFNRVFKTKQHISPGEYQLKMQQYF